MTRIFTQQELAELAEVEPTDAEELLTFWQEYDEGMKQELYDRIRDLHERTHRARMGRVNALRRMGFNIRIRRLFPIPKKYI